MEPSLSPDRNQPTFVPVALAAMVFLAGKWIAMHIESIDRNELFFSSSKYVQPWTVFQVLVWLPKSPTPLYVTVTASCVERTSAGFGIAAQISGISTGTQALWEQLYRRAAASQPRYDQTVRTAQRLKGCLVVMLEQALPGSVLAKLRQHGVTVQPVPSVAEALRLARGGSVDLVIGAVGSASYDGLDLCRQLAELGTGPRSILISAYGTVQDFDTSLCAGASRVIACPCRNGMLSARILTVLRAENRATNKGKRLKGKSKPQSEKSARRAFPRMAQLSGRVAAYWLNARSFFLPPTANHAAEITFL